MLDLAVDYIKDLQKQVKVRASELTNSGFLLQNSNPNDGIDEHGGRQNCRRRQPWSSCKVSQWRPNHGGWSCPVADGEGHLQLQRSVVNFYFNPLVGVVSYPNEARAGSSML